MNNLVIFITGPTGSGKTTVSKMLTKKINKCVNIDVDHVKHMIEYGFTKKELSNGTIDWQYSEWKLVGDSISLLAQNFIKEGFSVIINGYIGDDGFSSLNKRLNLTHKFLLLPNIQAIQKRDGGRLGDLKMGSEMVQKHYDKFNSDNKFIDFIKIDSSKQTPEETIQSIISHIIL